MKSVPIISSFNSGELSPFLAGRTDIKPYASGCRRIRNFIPTIQGPVRRRPGTRFVAEVKNSANRTWLYRFIFNDNQVYVLEFGNLYLRFYSNHGVVGAPFEIATLWTSGQMVDTDGTFLLRFAQSGDIIYVTSPFITPQKITRTGAGTFSVGNVLTQNGPFKDLDPNNTIDIYASAVTGAGITLTASAAIFANTHTGNQFRLEAKRLDKIKQWEPGKVVAANDIRRSNGCNYKAVAGGTTGTIRPLHTQGSRYDGDAGVEWTFQDPNYGHVLLTAFVDSTHFTATVIKQLPSDIVGAGNGTTRWAFQSWNAFDVFPSSVGFFRERLCYARGRFVWGSVAGDFENFADRDDGGIITADMSFRIDTTSDTTDDIRWLAPQNRAMLIGTTGDEHAMYEPSMSEAFGPLNITVMRQSKVGSRGVQPVIIGESTIYAQRSGRKVEEMHMALSGYTESWNSVDVTVMAEHITKGGIIQMAYQQEPDSVIWAIVGSTDPGTGLQPKLTDGKLIGFTFSKEQEVKAWHPHRLGGMANKTLGIHAVVESIISIPAPAGDRNEIWMIVRREINGAPHRYVEWMEYHHEQWDRPEDSFYVDCGLSLNNTKAATLTPGAGATVPGTVGVIMLAGSAIFAVGNVGQEIHYDFPVQDIEGNITWAKAIGKITAYTDTTHVTVTIGDVAWPNLALILSAGWRMTVNSVSGLAHLALETVSYLADGREGTGVVTVGGVLYLDFPASKVHAGLPCPAMVQPMPLETGAANGTAQGKTQRVSRAFLRFHETAGVSYGRDEFAASDRDVVEPEADGSLFTGDKMVSWPDGYDGQLLMTVMTDSPFPATLVAVIPVDDTQDDA